MSRAKQYTDEFKADAVKRFLELRSQGSKIRDIERVVGVPNSLLYTWANQAKKQSKQTTAKPAAAQSTELAQLPAVKNESGRFDPKIREEALQMLASGARIVDVARRVGVPIATVGYWKTAHQGKTKRPIKAEGEVVKAVNGIGSGGAITDALIYLRHAEKEIMDMVRDGKIIRPDQAHLLTLLALGCLQKSINK